MDFCPPLCPGTSIGAERRNAGEREAGGSREGEGEGEKERERKREREREKERVGKRERERERKRKADLGREYVADWRRERKCGGGGLHMLPNDCCFFFITLMPRVE